MRLPWDHFQGASGTYGGLDRFGRVKDQLWTEPLPLDGGGGGEAAGGGAAAYRFRYGHDRNSNRLYRTNELSADKDELYTYDGLDRLAKAERGTVTPGASPSIASVKREQNYTLSALGNWSGYLTKTDTGGGLTTDLDQTRAHNAVNEITGISETTGPAWADPVYDATGNMTSGPRGDNPTVRQHFKYDAWHRQVEVRADDSGSPGAIVATYRRDGLNRRVVKLLGANPADPDVRFDYYYNSAWQVLEERKDGGATAYAQYVWSLRYIDAPVLRDRDADADPDTGHLGVADSGLDERLFYTTDANMNVTALVDAERTVVERYVYDPYGTVTFLAADWTPLDPNQSAYANEILYCGYRLTTETGTYLVRRRIAHPILGTWITRESTFIDGLSLYLYCRSSPIVHVDPTGRQSYIPRSEAINIADAIRETSAHVHNVASSYFPSLPIVLWGKASLWDRNYLSEDDRIFTVYARASFRCDKSGQVQVLAYSTWHDRPRSSWDRVNPGSLTFTPWAGTLGLPGNKAFRVDWRGAGGEEGDSSIGEWAAGVGAPSAALATLVNPLAGAGIAIAAGLIGGIGEALDVEAKWEFKMAWGVQCVCHDPKHPPRDLGGASWRIQVLYYGHDEIHWESNDNELYPRYEHF